MPRSWSFAPKCVHLDTRVILQVSDAQLNAKIDSQSGQVILGVQPPDVYQQVIEKTKGLSFRSYVLAQNIEKRSATAA